MNDATMIERLMDGTITQSELQVLTDHIGSDAVRRIMEGERMLHEAVSKASVRTLSSSFMDSLMDRLRGLPVLPRWLLFVTRWTLPIGLFLALAGFATMIQFIPRGAASMNDRPLFDAPMLGTYLDHLVRISTNLPGGLVIGGIVVILALVIAVRLEHAGR